ncbi:anthranilate phosphoribosyltransferase [Algimonas porphyrae]|uniref:Anthranilate phosphoribosyltransferase n=1 Tax=Algimonas porphyrae TaxID=1128113 RepID=A0ABQ5UZW6_9PROT|nr:anthranilate phosphoribosyltransferase [Algimonas porphyrae]GLQ20305.1 anthranilate phosphoribosyltransferase [Algimonas porphyrae]
MSFDTDILKGLSRNVRPSEDQLRDALTSILAGDAQSEQIAALLLGLEMIGLGAREVRIGTEVMRANMKPVEIDADIIDIVGTGGTGLHTLSISTATAIVCAAAGAKVAKHGNRAASSLTGTADTLSELGVNLDVTPHRTADIIQSVGLGFLFAPNHHPAMRHVGPARKALGIRTLFNMLGPMSNPAGAQRMLLGVCDDRWRRPMAEALRDLGAEHLWVVHGSDGLDEITTTGPTYVTEVKDGRIADFTISPQSYGLELATLGSLRGGHPSENAASLTDLLDGNASDYRDIVILNAGAALMIAGLAGDVVSGMDMARSAIDSFHARRILAELVVETNR